MCSFSGNKYPSNHVTPNKKRILTVFHLNEVCILNWLEKKKSLDILFHRPLAFFLFFFFFFYFFFWGGDLKKVGQGLRSMEIRVRQVVVEI